LTEIKNHNENLENLNKVLSKERSQLLNTVETNNEEITKLRNYVDFMENEMENKTLSFTHLEKDLNSNEQLKEDLESKNLSFKNIIHLHEHSFAKLQSKYDALQSINKT